MNLFAAILMIASGGADSRESAGSLYRSAQELLRAGEPNKAMVVLLQLRKKDSLQLEVDRLMNQCRAKLGKWVDPADGDFWSDVDDGYVRSLREKPDSLARLAQTYAAAENFPSALRIYGHLARAHTADAAILKAHRDLLAQQERKVSYHRARAEGATKRGAHAEALEEWRLALSARPEDPVLQTGSYSAAETARLSQETSERLLNQALRNQDTEAALGILLKARIAFPGVAQYRTLEDSLQQQRRATIARLVAQVDSLGEAGNVKDALDAADALRKAYPKDPALEQMRETLLERLESRRRRRVLEGAETAFESALQQGNLGMAGNLVGDLSARGIQGRELEKMRKRLDSLQAKEKNQATFQEVLKQSRQALAQGDRAKARAGLQRAVEMQPDNLMARRLSVSVGAALEVRPPEVAVPKTADDRSGKVNALVLAGISAYRAGEYKVAMAKWKLALEMDPACTQAAKYLANVRRKQERLK